MRSKCITDSPYRTSINEAILRLQENGILRKLKDKWWKQERGGGQCNVSAFHYFLNFHCTCPLKGLPAVTFL